MLHAGGCHNLILTWCSQVTLVTPWIARCDQELVFPNNATFDSPREQEAAIREWVRRRSGHSPDFRIVFYAGVAPQGRRWKLSRRQSRGTSLCTVPSQSCS